MSQMYPPSMPARHAQAGASLSSVWWRGFVSCGFLVCLLGASAWWWQRGPQPIPLASVGDIRGSLLGKNNVPPEELCAEVRGDGDFHGAFREVDCLITIRRAFPRLGKQMDVFLLRKLRGLHERLRKESTDWRTVARWKHLYMLGARLYPVQNEQAEYAAIPVYEVNGHHLSVPFWIKESQRRDVGPLLHLDTHNDMRAVPSPNAVLKAVDQLKRGVNVKDAWHTIAHAIYDCAMPVAGGVLTAGYERVIWGKPSWNGYTEFLNRRFFFGVPKKGTPTFLADPRWSAAKAKKQARELKEAESKRSHYRLYYDPQMEPKKQPVGVGDAWITIQPAQRPVAEKFDLFRPFWLSILTSDTAITSVGKGEGAQMFAQLLQAIPKGRFTLDLDLDYFASVDSTDQFKRTAGSDPEWDQDLFTKRRKLLQPRLEQFRNMLIALKAEGRVPSVITIADSTYMTFALDSEAEGQSEYTPIEHTAHLRLKVREIFREVYGDQIDPLRAPVALPKKPALPKKTSTISIPSQTTPATKEAQKPRREAFGKGRRKMPTH